jgi:hypothetical protein
MSHVISFGGRYYGIVGIYLAQCNRLLAETFGDGKHLSISVGGAGRVELSFLTLLAKTASISASANSTLLQKHFED